MRKVTIYCDGACKGNPGPAGIGVVIRDAKGKVVKEIGRYIGEGTNNVAEYTALIHGLREALRLGANDVKCLTDSQLVVRQINGEYRIKNPRLAKLSLQVQRLARKLDTFALACVDRDDNSHADRLAHRAMKAALARTTKTKPEGQKEKPASGT